MDYRRLVPLLATVPPVGAAPGRAAHGRRDLVGDAIAMLAEARAASDRAAGRDPEAAVAAFAGAALDLRRRLVSEHGGAAGSRAWGEAMRRHHRPLRRQRGLHAA